MKVHLAKNRRRISRKL